MYSAQSRTVTASTDDLATASGAIRMDNGGHPRVPSYNQALRLRDCYPGLQMPNTELLVVRDGAGICESDASNIAAAGEVNVNSIGGCYDALQYNNWSGTALGRPPQHLNAGCGQTISDVHPGNRMPVRVIETRPQSGCIRIWEPLTDRGSRPTSEFAIAGGPQDDLQQHDTPACRVVPVATNCSPVTSDGSMRSYNSCAVSESGAVNAPDVSSGAYHQDFSVNESDSLEDCRNSAESRNTKLLGGAAANNSVVRVARRDSPEISKGSDEFNVFSYRKPCKAQGRGTPRRPRSQRKGSASPVGELDALHPNEQAMLSTVPGVVYDRAGDKWTARWSQNGKPFKKTFATAKYGFVEAKTLAKNCRLNALRQGSLANSACADDLDENNGVHWRTASGQNSSTNLKGPTNREDMSSTTLMTNDASISPRHTRLSCIAKASEGSDRRSSVCNVNTWSAGAQSKRRCGITNQNTEASTSSAVDPSYEPAYITTGFVGNTHTQASGSPNSTDLGIQCAAMSFPGVAASSFSPPVPSCWQGDSDGNKSLISKSCRQPNGTQWHLEETTATQESGAIRPKASERHLKNASIRMGHEDTGNQFENLSTDCVIHGLGSDESCATQSVDSGRISSGLRHVFNSQPIRYVTESGRCGESTLVNDWLVAEATQGRTYAAEAVKTNPSPVYTRRDFPCIPISPASSTIDRRGITGPPPCSMLNQESNTRDSTVQAPVDHSLQPEARCFEPPPYSGLHADESRSSMMQPLRPFTEAALPQLHEWVAMETLAQMLQPSRDFPLIQLLRWNAACTSPGDRFLDKQPGVESVGADGGAECSAKEDDTTKSGCELKPGFHHFSTLEDVRSVIEPTEERPSTEVEDTSSSGTRKLYLKDIRDGGTGAATEANVELHNRPVLAIPLTKFHLEDLCISVLASLGRLRPRWRRKESRIPFQRHCMRLRPNLAYQTAQHNAFVQLYVDAFRPLFRHLGDIEYLHLSEDEIHQCLWELDIGIDSKLIDAVLTALDAMLECNEKSVTSEHCDGDSAVDIIVKAGKKREICRTVRNPVNKTCELPNTVDAHDSSKANRAPGVDAKDEPLLAYNPDLKSSRQMNSLVPGTRVYLQNSVIEARSNGTTVQKSFGSSTDDGRDSSSKFSVAEVVDRSFLIPCGEQFTIRVFGPPQSMLFFSPGEIVSLLESGHLCLMRYTERDALKRKLYIPVVSGASGVSGGAGDSSSSLNGYKVPRGMKPACCPAPPGVEKICRCKCNHRRHELHSEIKQKLKHDRKACLSIIRDFPDLIHVINLLPAARTYQLEVISYLFGLDPWRYAKNRQEAPDSGEIPNIVARYKEMIQSKDYELQFKQWEEEQAREKSMQQVLKSDITAIGLNIREGSVVPLSSAQEARIQASVQQLAIGTPVCIRVKALLGLPCGNEQHIRGIVRRVQQTPRGRAVSVCVNNRKEEFVLQEDEVEHLIAHDDLRLVRMRSRQWFTYESHGAATGDGSWGYASMPDDSWKDGNSEVTNAND